MGLSKFFIDRPVFAWVLAIVIMLAGGIAAFSLPIEQYPTIAPPAVVVSATYPGADAQTVQNAVTQVIEQQLTGLDNLLYFSSTSNADGTAAITATFAPGTNPDIAQVQVQNKVQAAVPLLPAQVQQLGVVVAKNQPNFIIVVGIYDDTGRYDNVDISDFITSKMNDPLSRVPGVGSTRVFGAQYAMRIWLDPFKLHNFALQPSDVRDAVQAQNIQVSAGQIGQQPITPGAQLNATVTAQSRLQTPEQFRNIILKTDPSGAVVHLGDVGRVELGADNYGITSLFNGYPAAGVAIMLAPGANALKTVDAVKAKADELRASLPPGMKMIYPVDNTTFIRLSIHDVIVTLIEAIALVVLVMYVFLQNWRATLIPAIAVPVVLLGTFGVLAVAGYSVNTLTLFALVLVIGLLVDDAIVVVENVERIMHEERLPPREATLKSMQEITGALIGIGLVLTAVFLPMAFFGGSTGVIYRQFSVTIVSAMVLSIMVALMLSPAFCATLLRPAGEEDQSPVKRWFGWFNR
ncbi:MAG TPA: efflux RND transporter permease subunit, partial [Rhizomicrobium sp.]